MNPNNQTYDINHRDKLYYTMGGNIPVKTKQKVLKLWLSGVSRKKIAEKVAIGEGTVTSIVQEAKVNIPDVDLLHKLQPKLEIIGTSMSFLQESDIDKSFIKRV